MTTSSEGINAFVRYLTLGEDRRDDNPRLRELIPNATRVEFNIHGRELYSYGRHFPLARYVPGKRGKHALWLINGDRWGAGGWSLTNRHQGETRDAIANAIADAAKLGKVIDSIVIPFSALDGAGIDRDSIRPIHVRDDRQENFTNTADVPSWLMTSPLPTREQCEADSRARDPRGGAIQKSETLSAKRELRVTSTSQVSGQTETFTRAYDFSRSVCYRGWSYTRATSDNPNGGQWLDYDPPEVRIYIDGSFNPKVLSDNGTMAMIEWTTSRHWLGDSLFTAERVTAAGKRKRSRFVSSFDYNEPGALYFLAALPRSSRAMTVDMAIEDLAPPAVHAAYARGLAVKRQGDVFFIPTALTDADITTRAVRRTRLTVWQSSAKPRKGELGYRTPLTHRQAVAARSLKLALYAEYRAYSLSNTVGPHTEKRFRSDKRAKLAKHAETIARHESRIANGSNVCQCRTAYETSSEPCAVCGFPVWYHGYTVDNAARALTRERELYAAELARARNRDVGYASRKSYREKYGKCYRRALSAWESACRKAAERYTPQVDMDAVRKTLAVHGTSHTATEVAVCKRGTTYVKGIVRHVPAINGERRTRDHVNLRLDPSVWYLAIRNTVPTE